MRRLPSHPLHSKLQALTKNRLKRKSLNHLARELRGKQNDIIDSEINEETHLTPRGWNPTDLDVTICQEVPGLLTREQQIPALEKALTMQMLEERYPQTEWTHIYTDGSADDAVRDGGSGVYVRTPTGQTHTYERATGQRCSNFRAEVVALQLAAAHITEHSPDKAVILTDSKAALQALNSDSPDLAVCKLQRDLRQLPQQSTTVLQWIPAHCGIPGNERADRLAKSGSKQPQPPVPTTYPEAKTLLKNKRKAEWKRRTGDYNPTADPINNLQRSDQTTIFRLRTGHCGLKSHLKRIGVANSAQCDCRAAEQTVHHVLQDCPLLDAQWTQAWLQEVSTATKLWGTTEDLRCTIQFLASS